MTKDERKMLIAKYKRQFIAIKSAIDQWDPFDLNCYAPADEYDEEIAMILSRISTDSGTDTIADVVAEVFSEMFHDDFAPDECRSAAAAIRNNLNQL